MLLVYLMNGCAACEKEVRVITENVPKINPEVKIYGVMFQGREVAHQYVQAHHINFPILLDEDGELLKKLHLKYFLLTLSSRTA